MKKLSIDMSEYTTVSQHHNNERIMLHLPAYREPELIPTIKSALENAAHPESVYFGICRQYNPTDGFDNLDEFKDDKRIKVHNMIYTEAKGLPYASEGRKSWMSSSIL